MKIAWSPQFVRERQQVGLRHCCEDCVLFDHRRDSCAHEWPNATHRLAYYADGERPIDFCKEFELG